MIPDELPDEDTDSPGLCDEQSTALYQLEQLHTYYDTVDTNELEEDITDAVRRIAARLAYAIDVGWRMLHELERNRYANDQLTRTLLTEFWGEGNGQGLGGASATDPPPFPWAGGTR